MFAQVKQGQFVNLPYGLIYKFIGEPSLTNIVKSEHFLLFKGGGTATP